MLKSTEHVTGGGAGDADGGGAGDAEGGGEGEADGGGDGSGGGDGDGGGGDGGDDVPTTLPSGQSPGPSRPGTKYPVRGQSLTSIWYI